MDDNRRNKARHLVAVTAEVVFSSRLHEGTTRNLSEDGVNVEIDCELPDGATVGLTLLLTQDGVEDATVDPFENSATVVWSAPTDGDRWMAGLRFSPPADGQERTLARFLASLPGE